MTNLKAVLFDLDGTLVDSNEYHVDAWYEVFAEAGHEVPRERIRGQIGKGGDHLVPELLPDIGEATQKKLSEAHGERFKARYMDRVQPFGDAHALLARIRADGVAIVFASSAGKGEMEHYVGLLDAQELLGAATTIDDVGESKPAPDIFATALKKAGVAAEAAMAVGDSPFDMQSARRAGMQAVAVRSGGFDDAALTQAGAEAIYDDVADLLRRHGESPLAPR